MAISTGGKPVVDANDEQLPAATNIIQSSMLYSNCMCGYYRHDIYAVSVDTTSAATVVTKCTCITSNLTTLVNAL